MEKQTTIDKNKLLEYHNNGLSWSAIAERMHVNKVSLLNFRKTHNLPIGEKHMSNTSKKLCYRCRHMFLKKDMVLSNGWICKECYNRKW